MDASWPRRGQAASEASRVLRVSARHEGCGLFVPDLYEANSILSRAQSLHHTVDAVARKTEDHINAPIDNLFHEHVCRRLCHKPSPPLLVLIIYLSVTVSVIRA